MTLPKLWLKNLRYHARAHLAILLGCMIGSITLTGALLVGDLLHSKLAAIEQQRLGAVQYAVTCSRFFTSDLAERLANILGEPPTLVVPILQLRGTVLVRDLDGQLLRRAGSIQVLGVPPAFWNLFGARPPELTAGVAVNETLARRLRLSQGDLLEIRLPRPSAIPQETLAGRATDETGTAWQTAITMETRPVTQIIAGSQGGRFSLSPQQQRPATVYLSLEDLQRRLREPLSLDRPANVLLISATDSKVQLSLDILAQKLHGAMRLEDYGLRLRMSDPAPRYVSLETNRLILEDYITDTACRAAEKLGWSARPTLTYLVNLAWDPVAWSRLLSLAIGASCNQSTPMQATLSWRFCYTYIPYMTVSVLDPCEDTPWGPFYRWDGQRWTQPLKPGEILLTQPAARDLWPWFLEPSQFDTQPEPREVMIRYFVESRGWLLEEKVARLHVRGVLAWQGAAADPVLTPEFPGLRGTSPSDWKPPFPRPQWHPEWIRYADDWHWRQYRAAPRAFVSQETAEQLGWFSRYGKWTSVRLAPLPGQKLDVSELTRSLLDELEPEKLGFQTIALRDESQRALSQGPARMFSWLFLGFSLFLVSAALLLIVLLVRLQLLERAPEIGLLSAIGYSPRLVSVLLSTEFGAVIILGCLLGIPAAFAYAWGLLTWIEKRWPGPGIAVADVTAASFWRSVPVTSALLGFVGSILSAGLALLWAMRDLRGQSSRTLLLGRFQTEIAIATSSHLSKLALGFLAIMSLAGLICLGLALISPPQDGPIWFFLSGGVWLIVGLTILSITIPRVRPDVSERSWWLWLSIRFIARQPRRNTLTITLLALSTFTVTAVEVFYKSPQQDPFVKASGTGGFPLLAESDIPLPIIPSNHLDDWRPLLPEESSERLERLVKEFQHWRVRLYGLAVRPGDDVSCLNLYQPRQPRLLGVPTVLIQRDGFMFRELLENRHAENNNPWTALTQPDTSGVPMFADAQTAEWVLHLHLGQTIPYPTEQAGEMKLRLIGLLSDSIFQNALLISEVNFRRYFPAHAGYSQFLIETAPDAPLEQIARQLESFLGNKYGFSVRPTLEVLAEYHQVENLYLQTFQMLGALGLVLGTSGLAVVLLRNIYERRTELALLQALGYTPRMLAWVVLIENGLLVILGLGTGILAAAISISPYWYIVGAIQQSLARISMLMGVLLLVGILAGSAAMASVLRLRALAVLRQE